MGKACSEHGEVRNTYALFLESLKGEDHSEHLRVVKRIILKWISGT
jgi:hypothetical protein